MEIFKAYDVRGIYSKNLTEREAFLIGYYVAKYLNLEEFKVAHDLRLSHENLTKFFLKGLLHAGCKPLYLGALSTPNFYYSLFDGINSGVVITASHNSSEYNGFKFMNDLKSFDSRNGLTEVGNMVDLDDDNQGVIFNEIQHDILSMSLLDFISEFSIEMQESLSSYKKYLLDYAKGFFDSRELDILRERRFAYCFSSGMTSQVMVPVLKELEFNANFFLDTPDGNFPNYEPNPVNAEEYVVSEIEGVEGTFCYDGDGDRVAFYDEEQRLISEDYLIGSLINSFKDKYTHFVVDLRASKYLFELAETSSFTLEKMRVGRAFYQDYMQEHDCVFGAELSGHLFFSDFKYLDNPDIATFHSLRIFARRFLHDSSFRSSDELNTFQKYHKLKDTNIKVKNSEEGIEKLKSKFKSTLTSTMDGVSFDLGDVWFNVRASNTEPVLRITIEGNSKIICENKLEEIVSFLE
jgi:phosphomannomutase